MDSIKTSDAYNRTYVSVLNFLSYKPRSEREIVDRIERCKVSSQVKETVLEDIKEEGFIDDVRFAQIYIDGIKSSGKAKSARQLRTFLYKKGISDNIIDIVLREFVSEYEFAAAQKDGQKKLKSLTSQKKFQPHLIRQKLLKFLMGKGYSSDVVFTVVDTLLSLK